MTEANLSEKLLRFIQASLPTFTAAELLLFLAQHRDGAWKPEAIVARIQPTQIALPAVREYLLLFRSQGLVVERPDDAFQYEPATPELEDAVSALSRAYNERPVTLIRTIYTIADAKIQSFADSFRLKKEEE
jgi:hypothetical protein